jgi:hypothetical protein
MNAVDVQQESQLIGTQIWEPIMEKLERMLAEWIEDQHQGATPLSTIIIQPKAKSLKTISPQCINETESPDYIM